MAALTETPVVTVRPSKPDEAAYAAALAAAEAAHKEKMDELNKLTAKINLAFPSKSTGKNESPEQKRRDELISERSEIRKQQASFKSARQGKMDQLRKLDEQIKARQAEHKANSGKWPFKSIEDIDAEIRRLEAKVEKGDMKIVDEKKALADISGLTRAKKNFANVAKEAAQIEALRDEAKALRASLEDEEQKKISSRYDQVQGELNTINAAADEVFKNLSALRDEKRKLQSEQQATYAAIKKVKDDYFGAKRAYSAYEAQQREKHQERMRLERAKARKEAQLERAKEMLAVASLPAFGDEIHRASSLLKFLDPSAIPVEKAPLLADRGLGAKDLRKVEAATPDNFRALASKKDRDDEYFSSASSSKKGKKGKRGAAAGAAGLETTRGFMCPPSIVQDCAAMGVNPPMSASEVPAVIEQVKAKLENWQKQQAEETAKNIAAAKKEIARLEAEEDGEAPKTETSE